ncbi:MAG: hypothetical protein JXA41_08405 [Deltaproteobacteria bacterium]|nr:hypothetical protein [Deltaproteobacteria bacterium]
MRKLFVILILSAGLLMFTFTQVWAASGWTGNVNFTLGAKALDEDDWEPVDEHVALGINVDFRKMEWPVNLAIALIGSADDDDYRGMDIEGTTSEFRFGIKKIWEPTQTMRPFIGGGLALIRAELEGEYLGYKVSDDDTCFGFWIDGGIYWTINRSFNLGFELGYSKGEVTLFDVDGEAGGGHAVIIIGYHW